jgi:hypothetical protein
MPTNHDETLHERYAREHQAHLAIYARMTPEQISDMATELHNALARLAALSQQAEPTDTFTAVDMATAAAQGFRDGQAAVEQAPAEDEHQPVGWHTDDHLTDKSATTYDREVADRWRGKGWPVYELYARPAQAEQQPAYVECRECTDCGHVGINDAHQTDATCAMCDWSGPSPVEDQCPDCGKENVMGAACPKCSGRYRILAETHVAAPIAQTALSAVTAERDRLQSQLAEAQANDRTAMGYLHDVRQLVGGSDFPEMVRNVARMADALPGCVELIEALSPFEGDVLRKAYAAMAAKEA